VTGSTVARGRRACVPPTGWTFRPRSPGARWSCTTAVPGRPGPALPPECPRYVSRRRVTSSVTPSSWPVRALPWWYSRRTRISTPCAEPSRGPRGPIDVDGCQARPAGQRRSARAGRAGHPAGGLRRWHQIGLPRRGAGPRRWRRRMVRTEVADTLTPSLRHSPTMRTYPQRGFSRARRSTRSVTSGSNPRRRWPLVGYVHRRRISSRCRRSRVDGVTRKMGQRSRGSSFANAASSIRPAPRICRRSMRARAHHHGLILPGRHRAWSPSGR
jgi:hypothetical protein